MKSLFVTFVLITSSSSPASLAWFKGCNQDSVDLVESRLASCIICQDLLQVVSNLVSHEAKLKFYFKLLI